MLTALYTVPALRPPALLWSPATSSDFPMFWQLPGIPDHFFFLSSHLNVGASDYLCSVVDNPPQEFYCDQLARGSQMMHSINTHQATTERHSLLWVLGSISKQRGHLCPL
jgi:hypothetical protein